MRVVVDDAAEEDALHEHHQDGVAGVAARHAAAGAMPVVVDGAQQTRDAGRRANRDAGGAAEMYTDRVDALGYRPGDADDMATVISELVDNEPLRARLSAVSPQHVAKRFDRARWGHQLPTMYETLTRRMPLRMAA